MYFFVSFSGQQENTIIKEIYFLLYITKQPHKNCLIHDFKHDVKNK